MININFAQKFANDWIAAWNQHNLPEILSHYTDDFEMTTPLIQKMMKIKSGTLKGKDNVGQYWEASLNKFPDLQFEIIYITCGVNTVSICYKSVLGKITIETFFFNQNKKVYQALATYN